MLVKRTNLKVFTSKFVGTGPTSYKKIIYRAAVSQRLWNTAVAHVGDTRSECGIAVWTEEALSWKD